MADPAGFEKKNILYALVVIVVAVPTFIIFSQLITTKDNNRTEPENGFEQLEKSPALKGFYQITKYDPLFYSPYTNEGDFNFTNLQGYEELLFSELLEKQGVSLLKYYKAKGRKLNLLPHDFLEILPQNIKQTETFLANPTKEGAQKLLEINKRTVNLYKENLLDLGDVFDQITAFRAPNQVGLASLGRPLPFTTALKDLKLIQNNANALLEEVTKREKILNGSQKYKLPAFKVPAVQNEVLDHFREGNYLSKEEAIISLWENYNEEWKDFGMPAAFTKEEALENIQAHGPYQIEIACFPDPDNRIHLVYGFSSEKLELLYPRFIFGDGTVYRLPGHRSFDEISLAGHSQDVWIKDNPFTICSCPHIEDSKIQWYMLDIMHHKIKNSPLYANNTYNYPTKLGQLLEQGPFLEKSFIEYPTQSTLTALGINYKYLYLGLNEIKNISESLQKAQEQAWKHYTAIEARFLPLPRVLNFFHDILKLRATTGDFFYRYLSTPEFGVLEGCLYYTPFMHWSDSVWRLEEKPKLYGEQEEGNESFWNHFVPIKTQPDGQ